MLSSIHTNPSLVRRILCKLQSSTNPSFIRRVLSNLSQRSSINPPLGGGFSPSFLQEATSTPPLIGRLNSSFSQVCAPPPHLWDLNLLLEDISLHSGSPNNVTSPFIGDITGGHYLISVVDHASSIANLGATPPHLEDPTSSICQASTFHWEYWASSKPDTPIPSKKNIIEGSHPS